MRIRTFQGLRPVPERAAQVASLPYDVVTTSEARRIAAGNPLSFLHVVRAEIDLPEGAGPYAPEVYDTARRNLRRLETEGALVREEYPCMYVYQLQMDRHVQRGLVCLCHIEDYENNLIRKHEKTRPQKEDDRTTLNRTLRAHPGPVFLTYRDAPPVQPLLESAASDAPLIDFTASDEVRHTVWRVAQPSPFIEAFSRIPFTYVADGHHRSASAARVGAECRAANPAHTGREDYNWFLAVHFPASQLQILPYNRLVTDLNRHSPESFLAALRELARVTPGADPSPPGPGHVSMFMAGRWYGLAFPTPPAADPVARLDVALLQDRVLDPLLDIGDPRTSDRIEFIGGIRGTGELETRVNQRHDAVAFSMFPATVEQLITIADANAVMPPKSTWFEPKLRSGLFVHTF